MENMACPKNPSAPARGRTFSIFAGKMDPIPATLSIASGPGILRTNNASPCVSRYQPRWGPEPRVLERGSAPSTHGRRKCRRETGQSCGGHGNVEMSSQQDPWFAMARHGHSRNSRKQGVPTHTFFVQSSDPYTGIPLKSLNLSNQSVQVLMLNFRWHS